MAIMHSSACYPTLQLWSDNQQAGDAKVLMDSLVVINAPGHRTIHTMKPEWFTRLLSHMSKNVKTRALFKALGGTCMVRGVRSDPASADNALFAVQTMHFAGVQRMNHLLQQIRETETPTVFFYTEKDKLIEKEIFHEMIHLLGSQVDHVSHLDAKGVLVGEGHAGDNWLKILCIKDGGHYAFKSCSHVLHDEIMRMMADRLGYAVPSSSQAVTGHLGTDMEMNSLPLSDETWLTSDR